MAAEQGTPPEDTKPTGVGSHRRQGVTIDLEAETTEFLKVITDDRRLPEIEFEYRWKEQVLSRHSAFGVISQDGLEADPFMRGVLVNEDQVVTVLTEQITAAVLSDDLQ